MQRKLNFWSILAIVMGSQIGSGILMLPASLAEYGKFSLAGWLISTIGAMSLCLVFASLCSSLPKNGGPHVYVQQAFGNNCAFFTGWTYWVISWVSTTAVIITCIGYLSPFIASDNPLVTLSLEILLLLIIMFVNLQGISTAGRAEFYLTILKFIPLLILPIAAIFHFNSNNFIVASSKMDLSTMQITSQAALLTFWGFVGLESATAPAASVEDPTKTIPRAIIIGTGCVALIYVINSIGIMGIFPGNILANSKAPYVDAAQILFGGHWYLVISAIASLVCIGTLNAWILTSGQVAQGLAESNFMPKLFQAKNKNNAPVWSIVISSLGIIPLLVMTTDQNLGKQINSIIDISVTAFLFIYLICALSFFKLLFQSKSMTIFKFIFGAVSVAFCLWVIMQTNFIILIYASLFTLSGVPVYYLFYKKQVS